MPSEPPRTSRRTPPVLRLAPESGSTFPGPVQETYEGGRSKLLTWWERSYQNPLCIAVLNVDVVRVDPAEKLRDFGCQDPRWKMGQFLPKTPREDREQFLVQPVGQPPELCLQ